MRLGIAEVIRANARHLPLPDDSVDLVVTSPPYFALRSYQDGGEHYPGQIGDEATPAEFVASLLEVTAECVRVLKPSGSLWVNLGDSYSRGARPIAQPQHSVHKNHPRSSIIAKPGTGHGKTKNGIPAKSLSGIPWRYALACIDDLGLILRAEVIWSKPNGLPESVGDRVRRSHETWFHFTLEPRYFSAVDEIREAHLEPDRKRADMFGGVTGVNGVRHAGASTYIGPANPLGKLPGSVWTIPTEPLRVPDHLGIDHFAAFPTAWPKRIIQGWSPAGVCVECGEGRRPVASRKPMEWRPGPKANGYELESTSRKVVSGTMLAAAETTITGYACACPDPTADTRPAVILDPFGGTGTTALVAKALGRHGISVDMSADYCRLAAWRTNDRDQLAKVLEVAKAEQQPVEQDGLFEMDGGAA